MVKFFEKNKKSPKIKNKFRIKLIKLTKLIKLNQI